MKAHEVMRRIMELSVVEKNDIFPWCDEKGLFNCSVSVHTKNHEREVFKVLRELPPARSMHWRSYNPGLAVGFTCLTLIYGDYKTGKVDIDVYIYDVD